MLEEDITNDVPDQTELEGDVPNVPNVVEDISVDGCLQKESTIVGAKRCNPFCVEGQSSSSCKRRPLNYEDPFDIDSLESDPALRRPISDYSPNDQDVIRRAYLLKGPCQPDITFPTRKISENDKQNRGFGRKWYTEFSSWLEYSVSKDAAFCLYCYLFWKGVGADNFVVTGFRNWKKNKAFVDHVGKVGSAHNHAYMLGQNLLNQNQSIVAAILKQTDQAREDYKDRLEASIKVVRLLLELGLPFRGHDESDDSMTKGKFQTCLRFLVDNNKKAKNMKKKTPKNAKMTSPKIQKDIVKACALETVEAIRRDIGDSCFALLVDESRDVSIKEQMVVAVRYVDKRGCVMERIIGFVHVLETTSVTLKEAIDSLFAKNNLSISKLRGQGYDGANNMRGEYNGLKALILRENKSAYFIHCFAHQLQLTLVHVAQHFTPVFEFFEKISLIITLASASCKRNDQLLKLQLEQVLQEVESGERLTGRGLNQETSLRRAAETRWGTHYESLLRIISMYNAVCKLLKIVQEDGLKLESRKRAESLGYSMSTFDFVFKLHMMRKVLGITNNLSKCLQMKDQDIVNAMRLVNLCKDRFKALRSSGWEDLLLEVTSFCEKNDIIVPNMDDIYSPPGRPRRGIDITTSHYYCHDLFYEVIAHQMKEFDDYFPELATDLISCVGCLSPTNNFSSFDKSKLLRLAEYYENDFSRLELLALEDELDMYYLEMEKNTEFSDLKGITELSVKMVETRLSLTYRLVYRLITLALILPVATATVERAFSAMKLVKTERRNKISDSWMSDSLLTFIEKDVFFKMSGVLGYRRE
ncbi:hypothetical protein ACHQM5_017892 [Ranunculus cassubicifolius]